MSKRRSKKGQKGFLHGSNEGGQNGSKILPKRRSLLPKGQKGAIDRVHGKVHGSKRRSTWVKNLTKKEVLPKMGQKRGLKGSKIYGSC